jgi:hypothetical protein
LITIRIWTSRNDNETTFREPVKRRIDFHLIAVPALILDNDLPLQGSASAGGGERPDVRLLNAY